MNIVTVDKSALIETVKDNRTIHEREYDKARDAYRQKLEEHIRKLDQMVTDNKSTEMITKQMAKFDGIPQPRNYLGDYDRAIEMLEWERNTEVLLEKDQFRQLVMDDWSWKNNFTVSNSTILSA